MSTRPRTGQSRVAVILTWCSELHSNFVVSTCSLRVPRLTPARRPCIRRYPQGQPLQRPNEKKLPSSSQTVPRHKHKVGGVSNQIANAFEVPENRELRKLVAESGQYVVNNTAANFLLSDRNFLYRSSYRLKLLCVGGDTDILRSSPGRIPVRPHLTAFFLTDLTLRRRHSLPT